MQHIMFDVDGTLVQSYEFDEACFIDAVADVLGHRIDSDWGGYQHVTDSGILHEHLLRQGISSGIYEIHQAVKQAFILRVKNHLAVQPARPVAGAAELITRLKQHLSVTLSIATGGWQETAQLKLASAGIDVSGVPLASSDDHFARIEIMQLARRKADETQASAADRPVTYFGDAAWDQVACSQLGYNFVLVGKRIRHPNQIDDLSDLPQIMSLLGL